MHAHKRRSRALLVLPGAALALYLAGCGGVTRFEGQTAIAVASPVEPPPEAPKRVELKADRIEIHEKILFEIDKADILPASHGLLNEVVDVLKEQGSIKRVDIVGHTDDYGTPEYNQGLSERRAKAVMTYLVGQGIEQGRLSSKGMGESQPIADNSSMAGKEKNRRVEFLILEQEGVSP